MHQKLASTSSQVVDVTPLSANVKTLLFKRCVAVLTSHAGSMFMSALGSDKEVQMFLLKIKAETGQCKLKGFLQSFEQFVIENDGQRDVVYLL